MENMTVEHVKENNSIFKSLSYKVAPLAKSQDLGGKQALSREDCSKDKNILEVVMVRTTFCAQGS